MVQQAETCFPALPPPPPPPPFLTCGDSSAFFTESTVRKKMAAVHFTTISCEPNRAISTHIKTYFGEIHPCTSLRAGSQFPRYNRCGTSGEAASYESASAASRRGVWHKSRLVTRAFAARATSIITTKMRDCSHAIHVLTKLSVCKLGLGPC